MTIKVNYCKVNYNFICSSILKNKWIELNWWEVARCKNGASTLCKHHHEFLKLFIEVKFCTGLHGPERMYPTNLGDSLTFHLEPLVSHSLHLSCKIIQHTIDRLRRLVQNAQMLSIPRGYILQTM